MNGFESLNLFGNALLVVLHVGLAGYGLMLAVGRSRLTSPFTLQPAGVRRSRITGVLLVIGQLFSLLLVAMAAPPSSALVLTLVVVAGLLGWILDGLLPGGRSGEVNG